MEANTYQQATNRTRRFDYVELSADQAELLNWATGIAGEAGEINELVKKFIFHEHPLSSSTMMKELGDLLWYVAQIAQWYNLSLETVMQTNLDKLADRYPD